MSISTAVAYADSLNSLTETKVPSWSKLVPSSLKAGGSAYKSNRTSAGPIPEQMLMVILYFLFPDADSNNSVIKWLRAILKILTWLLQSNAYAEDFEQDEQPTTASFKEVKAMLCSSLQNILSGNFPDFTEGKCQVQKLSRWQPYLAAGCSDCTSGRRFSRWSQGWRSPLVRSFTGNEIPLGTQHHHSRVSTILLILLVGSMNDRPRYLYNIFDLMEEQCLRKQFQSK